MQKRQLGKNGPELSVIGLGAWAIGGSWQWGWGQSDDKESIKTIQRALELGINWIDTAPVYGLGHSEEIVGKAIRDFSNVFIATKCGLVWNDKGKVRNELSPFSIRQEVEDSLRRLNVDVIDLIQFHWPDPDRSVERSWETMVKLKQEGKVRYIGVSNFDVPLLEKCMAIEHVTSLQPQYSLKMRHIESEILPYCLKNDIGIIPYSPMFSGLLTGRFDINKLAQDDWRRKNPEFSGELLEKNLAGVKRLSTIAQKYDKTAGQLAVAWVLQQQGITSAIVGARKVVQVEENVKAADFQIDANDLEEIEQSFSNEKGPTLH